MGTKKLSPPANTGTLAERAFLATALAALAGYALLAWAIIKRDRDREVEPVVKW